MPGGNFTKPDRPHEGGNSRGREAVVLLRLAAHRDQAPNSIVEGISVFLSFFDDNPKVKRTFARRKSVTTRS